MAQKSGVYVLYRKMPGVEGATVPFYTYLKQVRYRENRDDNNTDKISEAIRLDKRGAFEMAVGETEKWCVGELISDNKGVRVEE